jgi:hypothetical protein
VRRDVPRLPSRQPPWPRFRLRRVAGSPKTVVAGVRMVGDMVKTEDGMAAKRAGQT